MDQDTKKVSIKIPIAGMFGQRGYMTGKSLVVINNPIPITLAFDLNAVIGRANVFHDGGEELLVEAEILENFDFTISHEFSIGGRVIDYVLHMDKMVITQFELLTLGIVAKQPAIPTILVREDGQKIGIKTIGQSICEECGAEFMDPDAMWSHCCQ